MLNATHGQNRSSEMGESIHIMPDFQISKIYNIKQNMITKYYHQFISRRKRISNNLLTNLTIY